jgi:hypothetical protein
MTKSCKSQGKRNKTMKKNTKKMQGGTDGEKGINPSTVVPPQVGTTTLNAVKDDPIVAQKVDTNSTTTTGIFSRLSSLWPFGSSEEIQPKKGGKRKSKSNKSHKKKSKYNKK